MPKETPGMPTGVGTKFRDHFHYIPLPPNHPLITNDIESSIALTMAIIMISPLIWGYKYKGLGKGNGCWEVLKEIESKERESESEPESKDREWTRETRKAASLSLCAENNLKYEILNPLYK